MDVEKLESGGVVLFSVRCCKQAIPKPVNRFSASVQYWLANIGLYLMVPESWKGHIWVLDSEPLRRRR